MTNRARACRRTRTGASRDPETAARPAAVPVAQSQAGWVASRACRTQRIQVSQTPPAGKSTQPSVSALITYGVRRTTSRSEADQRHVAVASRTWVSLRFAYLEHLFTLASSTGLLPFCTSRTASCGDRIPSHSYQARCRDISVSSTRSTTRAEQCLHVYPAWYLPTLLTHHERL